MDKLPTFKLSEIELLSNRKILQRKNQVLEKITSELQKFAEMTEGQLPNSYKKNKAKVSRGENFQGYPFRILDYPRIFTTKDVFAFRTLIWWGNIISFTLHLKGKYLITHFNQLKQLIIDCDLTLYYSSTGDEWSQNPSDKNYKLLDAETLTQLKHKEIDFLKIVQIEQLDKINQLNELYQLFLNQLIVPLFYDRI